MTINDISMTMTYQSVKISDHSINGINVLLIIINNINILSIHSIGLQLKAKINTVSPY